jgi:hypothetical protein
LPLFLSGQSPLADDDHRLLSKFKDQFNVFGGLRKAHAQKIVDLALNIDNVKDMREYTGLLVL